MKTPRKIMFAVYCDDDEQALAVQNIVKEFCSNFNISAVDIMSFYPMIKNNRGLIKQTVQAITKGGKAAALRLVPQIIMALWK